MARNQAEDTNTADEIKINPTVKSDSNYICHAEFEEGGKTVHYLYNPDEKDSSKAWKKSDKCSQ